MTPQDEVEISAVGKMMDDVSRVSGLREQRLAQIKAAIENGTYDTPEKLELALGRMLDQISRDEPH
jgi:negative regulator of flagellin synthesis FlgM